MFGLVGIILGIIFILIGIFNVFFFPASSEHQPGSMTVTGMVLGIILLVTGFILVFL